MDMHIHSSFSDGKNSILEMASVAHKLGIKKICFTDHVRKDSTWFNNYILEIERVRKLVPIEICIGVEAKIIDFNGNLDVPDNLPKEVSRVAAIHRITDGKGGYISKSDSNLVQSEYALECWFNALEGLGKNKEVSRIAHPFSMIPFLKPKMDDGFWKRLETIFDRSNYSIELNFKYDNSFVPDSFWKRYKDRLIIGSDSHSIEDLQRYPDKVKEYRWLLKQKE